MENKKIFELDTTPTLENHWIIRMNHEQFKLGPTVGSYNLIMARLFNMSYPNFLRLCRDEFGATIIGKNTYYPVAYFSNKIIANRLCDLLNARANYILWEAEHPDNKEKEEYIKNFNANNN